MKRTKATFNTWQRKDGKPCVVTVSGWRLTDDKTTVFVYRVSPGSHAYHVISPCHGLSVGVGVGLEECMEIARIFKDYINGDKPVRLPEWWRDPQNK